MFRPLPALLLGVATSGALAGCHRLPAEVAPVQRFLQPIDPGQTRWELAHGAGVVRGVTPRVTYQRALAAGAIAPVDPELREKMRALGYVQ